MLLTYLFYGSISPEGGAGIGAWQDGSSPPSFNGRALQVNPDARTP
jgi:hypothetical protein